MNEHYWNCRLSFFPTLCGKGKFLPRWNPGFMPYNTSSWPVCLLAVLVGSLASCSSLSLHSRGSDVMRPSRPDQVCFLFYSLLFCPVYSSPLPVLPSPPFSFFPFPFFSPLFTLPCSISLPSPSLLLFSLPFLCFLPFHSFRLPPPSPRIKPRAFALSYVPNHFLFLFWDSVLLNCSRGTQTSDLPVSTSQCAGMCHHIRLRLDLFSDPCLWWLFHHVETDNRRVSNSPPLKFLSNFPTTLIQYLS